LKICFEEQVTLLNQYIETKKPPRYINSLATSIGKMLQHESGKGKLTDEFKDAVMEKARAKNSYQP